VLTSDDGDQISFLKVHAFDDFIGSVNVLGVVLVVVDFHRSLADVGLKSIVGVWKRGQSDGHV